MARTPQRTFHQFFTVTSGDSITGDDATGGAGGDLAIEGGSATAASTGAAGSLILRPGLPDGAGARGIVNVTNNGGADSVPILQLTSQGSNAEDVRLFVGTRNPSGAVSGNPGDLYVRHNGVASSFSINNGAADANTTWLDLGVGSLSGTAGLIYANLVFYMDPSDRNSYSATGTSVIDIMGNASAGTLTSETFSEGSFAWNGVTGALTFTKNTTLNNLFAGGGTAIAFIRPTDGGENNEGRIIDTTQSGDAGWFFATVSPSANRVGLRFQRNFDAGAADAGQWVTLTATDPWSGVGVLAAAEGSWSCVAVTYDDSSTANDPIFYVNGAVFPITETVAPVGTAITDVGTSLVIANRTADDRTFNGSIANILLFDRILSQNEIIDIYNLLGRRFGLGQTGFVSTAGLGQDITVIGGLSATAGVRSGNVLFAGGDNSAASGGGGNGGDVTIRAGSLTGISNGRSGNLIVLAGSVTNSGGSGTAGSAEFGAGVHNNGNAAGTCTVHGGDNSNQGIAGLQIVRGGDCITATSTNDGGGNLNLRGGNARTAGGNPGNTFIAGGGFLSGVSGTTGDITISTTRNSLGSFPATGGTATNTGSISILTTGPGATAGTTGNITIQCGDVAATSGANPGDISIQAGSASNTTQANATSGGITLTAGANAGAGNSTAGSITLTAGAATGSGATSGQGGDILLTAGNIAKNSSASRAGNVTLTCGSATGTAGTGGSFSVTAGASTGAGTAGTVQITSGTGGTTGTGGSATMSGGSGGSTSGAGGAITIRGGLPTDGNGGAANLLGRNAATVTSANRAGGAVNITAGNSTGITQGAAVSIQAGHADAVAGTGTGGVIFIFGGNGGSTSGGGGDIGIAAGSATAGNSSGGDINLAGGSATGTSAGGDINKTPGPAGTGRPGLEFSLGATADNAFLSPAALASGTTQDYTVANLHTRNVLRFTPDAAGSALGGLEHLSGQDGRTIWIINAGTVVGQTLTLNHEDGGSTAGNRFFLAGGSNVVLPFGAMVRILWDPTTQRWRADHF